MTTTTQSKYHALQASIGLLRARLQDASRSARRFVSDMVSPTTVLSMLWCHLLISLPFSAQSLMTCKIPVTDWINPNNRVRKMANTANQKV